MFEQTCIHSLQIYTPGPATIFSTLSCVLPQNEHLMFLLFSFFCIISAPSFMLSLAYNYLLLSIIPSISPYFRASSAVI